MDERSLIARIKRSDRDAFDTLCRACVPSLLTYAGLLLKSDWAEDVVQAEYNLSAEVLWTLSVIPATMRSVSNPMLP